MASKIAPLSFTFFIFLVIMHCSSIGKVQSKGLKSATGFNSLGHLEGSQKGQQVEGLEKVRKYLTKFGYLNNNVNLNKEQQLSENADLYDDTLESAIKKYQAYYQLKVTGTLDRNTIQKMMLPRCGNPDVITGTSFVTSPDSHNKKLNKIAHTVMHFNLYANQEKWPPSKTHLTYGFNSSATPNVQQKVFESVCLRAFATWSTVTKFTFEKAQQGHADIMIGFHRGDHGDGNIENIFDGKDIIHGHSFPPPDGRLHLDADETWSTKPGENLDLESIVLHEIGHILGLNHSDVKSAVMYAYTEYGAVKRKLQPDDIEGIQALYS